MKITEVRIKLMANAEDRLRGFCSITFDNCFVVRDLKIIAGNSGPFVAMPSRKLSSHCYKCGYKNHLKARYCNSCGSKQKEGSIATDGDGRAKLYADIAHPVNAACREMIQNCVIEHYERELELSKSPSYRSRYDDGYDASVKIRVDSPQSGPNKSHSNYEKSDSPQESQADSPQEKTSSSGDSFGSGIVD